MSKLKVSSLKIQDVLGITQYSMEPGKVTLISGDNAAGKTSVMRSIDSVLEGGDLAKLARIGDNGEEIDPEIVMVLESDEGQKFMVEKNTKSLKVRAQVGDSAGFEDVPQPARFLKGLYDNHMFSPVKFMEAPNYSKDPKKKDRIRMLLGALPVELDREQLWKDMKISKKDISPVPEGLHPLIEMNLITESIKEKRKGINRDAKSKAGSAEQIRRSIPAVLPDGHDDEIEELEKSISAKEREITERVEQAKGKCEVGCNDAQTGVNDIQHEENSRHEQWASSKRAELEKKIAEQKADLEVLIAEDLQETNDKIAEAMESRDELQAEFRKERDSIVEQAFKEQSALESDRTKLTEMREAGKAAVKAKALHEQAEAFDDESKKLGKISQKLTFALNALDKKRREMANNLPIKGLAVVDKEIQLDGISYDHLNTAKQIKLAVQIACLRSKEQELPLVKVDGAEALGSKNFELFVKYLNEENAQSFIGKRTVGELTTTIV